MPAHRTTPLLTLSEDDRHFMEQVRDSRTEEIRRVERARIILAYSEGLSVASVAQIVAVSKLRCTAASKKLWPWVHEPRSKTCSVRDVQTVSPPKPAPGW